MPILQEQNFKSTSKSRSNAQNTQFLAFQGGQIENDDINTNKNTIEPKDDIEESIIEEDIVTNSQIM